MAISQQQNHIEENVKFLVLHKQNIKINEKIHKMEFRAANPGASQYGNFINYYQFNTAEDRMSLFPLDLWKRYLNEADNSNYFIILDVGCNAGNISQLLYEFYEKQFSGKHIIVLGIDLDEALIHRANEANKYPGNVFYEVIDLMACNEAKTFTGFLNNYDSVKFNAVFCLSITMWIHLNNGDEGLVKFLGKTSGLTSNFLVIEPQPWKCYVKAISRMKKTEFVFEHFKTLTMRNSVERDIQNVLIKQFGLVKIFETIPTKWNRKILFFNKNPSGGNTLT